MERDIFKVGAEHMEFMGESFPIIDEMMAIIKHHNDEVNSIRDKFHKDIASAKDSAAAKYKKLCEQTQCNLKGIPS